MSYTLSKEARVLFEKREYDQALKIYSEIEKNDINHFKRFCLESCLWCIYRGKVNTHEAFFEDNLEETKKYIAYILKHLSNKDILFQFTVLKMVKYYRKSNDGITKIDEWLNKLDPILLSEQAFQKRIQGDLIYIASIREEWYVMKSENFYNLRKYNECIEISEEALNTIKNFHNENEKILSERMSEPQHLKFATKPTLFSPFPDYRSAFYHA